MFFVDHPLVKSSSRTMLGCLVVHDVSDCSKLCKRRDHHGFQDCLKLRKVVALCFLLFGVLSVVSRRSGGCLGCVWSPKPFKVVFGRFG